MKTIVNNEKDQTRIPFLRGILIRSLLDAGLEFDDAYRLASDMRDALADVEEVSSDDIRQRVCEMLEEEGHLGALEPYRLPLAAPGRIVVTSRSRGSSAFSRGKHERYLRAAGVKAEKAEQTTSLVYEHLLAAGATAIDTCTLGYLTYLALEQEVSRKAAKRYLVWSEYQRSGRPLILMICGTVGTGKSTIATEVAHLLDVVRIQSTDMLREVMRMMLPEKLLPVLHASSFNAWKVLPIQDVRARDRDLLVADGYHSQAGLLSVAIEAVIHRAVEESVPIILEGVHAHPEISMNLPEDTDAITVHTTLAVLKSKELKRRLRGRGAEVPQRRAKRYLNTFESIWSLQTFLLSESDRCDVPIITNTEKEKTIHQVILQVNYELSRHFEGSPRDVFGEVVERAGELAEDADWFERVPALLGV
ncbi:MAG: AAA family ATPase [Xanthomonadales bacterium]